MNKKKSILESNVLYTIIAIIAGFLIGAIFLMIAGISPAVAYGKLFSSIFSKPKYLVWTLVYASPLIFTGLSVAFSFRTGVFNIGAEGQFVIGGLVACVLGIVLFKYIGGAGISTCCPSATPFGLTLGPDLPWADEPSPGNLRLSMAWILTMLSLLIPAFSLLLRPHVLSIMLRPTTECSSTTHTYV